MVRDPNSGKYRRTRLFVLTLGSSRKPPHGQKSHPRRPRQVCSAAGLPFECTGVAELHEKAFRRLGGSPRIVVLDNLRVLSPDFYDPGLNPLYRDVLAHYGVTALPCKVRDPDRKGKVESGVAHAQKTPLKGKKFESLEEAQTYWITGKSTGPTRASNHPSDEDLSPGTPARPDQAAGSSHVRPRETPPASAAAGAVPLLPVWRAHGASGWLRRSEAAYYGAPPG